MTKPPFKINDQSGYVKSALRMPEELRNSLIAAAATNGRSLNAEIVARLQANPLEDIKRQNEEIKTMLRRLLDKS